MICKIKIIRSGESLNSIISELESRLSNRDSLEFSKNLLALPEVNLITFYGNPRLLSAITKLQFWENYGIEYKIETRAN